MTTYVATPPESGEAIHAAVETVREQAPVTATRRAPRRGAFTFVSGFIFGAVTTTIVSILGRRRQRPFVAGNRNVFVSLPFSGISMVAPAAGAKKRGPGSRRFTRWSRGMARSMARGAASGVYQGASRRRSKKRAK
jgi:hypothetical protein